MAGFISTAYLRKCADYLWGVTDINSGTILTPYVALSSTLPAADGTNVTEPNTGTNYGNYVREAFASPTTASGGSASNGGAITFPTPATHGGFDAKYFAVYDASTSGTMMWAGTLTQELICNLGVPVVAAIGAFTLSLTDVISGLTAAGANILIDILTGRVAPSTNFPAAIYLSAYTTLPTNSQTADTNEAAYTSYARVSTAGKIAASTNANPTVTATNAEIDFPVCTGSSSTIVGWGAGPGSSGATALYMAGATTSQAIGTGNQPILSNPTNLSSLS